MKTRWYLSFLLGICATLLLIPSLPAQCDAVTPADKKDDWWVKRHEANVERMNQGNIDLLMIGDSITHGWEGKGKKVWDSYYAQRKPINLGFSGDRTQHVLWRLDHLPLDKISPKAAMVMIGTNNIGQKTSTCTPKETAEGIKAIVERLEKAYPRMKILVLNVFPRDHTPDEPFRKKVNEINSYLPELLAGKSNVTLLDINSIFLDENKNLPKEIMADMLHPGTYGYELWAKAADSTLSTLLSESNPAIIPADRLEVTRKNSDKKWWKERHEANVERMNQGDVEFLMIGDSITHGWDGHPELVDRFFGKLKPINLGFGGDQTQHVLWRLDHLPLDRIKPKSAMIMIGTNNTGRAANTPQMIAVGIKAIVEKLQKQYPEMKIVVLKVFPRSEKPDAVPRHRVEEINLALPELLDGMKNVVLFDVGEIYLNEDGTISKEIMPDFLHLGKRGYEMWGEKVQDVVTP